MSYYTRVDIANRALQHLGVPRIAAFTDSSRQARETSFTVDKLRRAELQRSVWTFATRRCVMREIVSTTKDFELATWSNATTYGFGDVIQDSYGFPWLSLSNTNLNQTPGSDGFDPFWIPYFGPRVAQLHSGSVAYLPGDLVQTGTSCFLCLAAHTNQTPPNASYWQEVAGAVATARVEYSPLGYEKDASTLRKKYKLPANYLRMAPQDPKMAAGARLNTTAGMAYNDWEVEEPYLFTDDSSPFVLRFVADVTDVSQMHPMFCEVWAARMALELADSLTQNDAKKQAALGLLQQYTTLAQQMNAIEAGTTENEPTPAPPQQGR